MDKFRNYKLAAELYECIVEEINTNSQEKVGNAFEIDRVHKRTGFSGLSEVLQTAMARGLEKFLAKAPIGMILVDTSKIDLDAFKKQWREASLNNTAYVRPILSQHQERFKDSGIAGIEKYTDEQKEAMTDMAQRSNDFVHPHVTANKPETLKEWFNKYDE